ncbi:MAG: paraquat-inducible protein A [Pseudomonadales bacterium]|nr:paraquat-inducible protein A [Pseudomonadales bacterium]
MSDDIKQLVACHECDAVYTRVVLHAGAKALCSRCGYELYRHISESLEKSLALYITTLICMLIANVFPFLAMKTAGLYEQSLVVSSGWALYQFGMAELGLVVFIASIIAPLVITLGMLYLLVPLKFGVLVSGHGPVLRLIRFCRPFSLMSVFLLGTIIAVVKLQSLATVVPGIGLLAFVLMLFAYTAASATFDPEIIWQYSNIKQLENTQLKPGERIYQCHVCGLIRTEKMQLQHDEHCQRCGSSMHYRIEHSLQRCGALLVAALMMLIPANIYPIMTVISLGRGAPDTILSGVVKLISHGMWGLGLIVLFASIVVPLLKLFALSYLLYSVRVNSSWRPKDRTLLYRCTEVLGAWSMVDVFLVGLLCGLVKLGFIATIEPGIGASFFAAAVVLTMLAAQSFDPRLIWDGLPGDKSEKSKSGVMSISRVH